MVENVGGVGEKFDMPGTTNILSWNVKVWPETEMPERPVVAGKGKVKGYERVGPQTPVPVSAADIVPVALVVVVFPFRPINMIFKVAGGAAAPAT